MRRRTSLAATLGVVACAILGIANFAEAGKIDAVSGSSIKVTGGTTTATSATINYTFGETGGTRRLYYDVADHTTASSFPKFASTTSNTFTISGLKGGTKYFYWILLTDGRHQDGSLHTAATVFSTDAAAGILAPKNGNIPNQTSKVDPLGRQSPNRGPIQINQFGTQIELNEGHR
ncbi:MAG: hypothetical protein RL173_1323 [Fibrobacterota bacterium]|jgi:hypothetical protein